MLRAGTLVLAVLLLTATAPAGATVVSVTITTDSLAMDGQCSLREAVLATNTNTAVDGCPAGGAGPAVVDVIDLPAGTYLLTLGPAGDDAGLSGDLDLTDDVEIRGAGARLTILDADRLDRLFEADPSFDGRTVRLVDLQLREGDSGGGNGGGIRNAGTLTLERVSLLGCFATGAGGGIRNDGFLTILDSTIANNTTEDHGGGIDNHGTAFLTNVTVSGNTVNGGGAGGGLYTNGGQSMTVVSSTVTGNSAGSGPAIRNNGSMTLTNVLVDGVCAGNPLASGGGNLESPGDTCGLALASDQTSVADPQLEALGDYGGPTDTLRPLATSAAVDAGVEAGCPSIDQRLGARPTDGDGDDQRRCDVGAHELSAPLGFFLDGFESGDFTAWTRTGP